jgi:hypothetical protein
MRPLIDKTPLRLWDGPEDQPERPPDPPAPLAPVKHCLKCNKPHSRPSNFCSAKCRTSWQTSMNAWHARLEKTRGPEDQDLFE